MRHVGALLATLLLVPLAEAAEKEAGDFSLLGSFVQMLASLALVLGAIFLVQALSRRWLNMRGGGGGESRHIRLVETRYLAPKKSLMLVEVGGEYLLLSDGNEGVRLIKQVEVKESVELGSVSQVAEPHCGTGPASAGRGAWCSATELLDILVRNVRRIFVSGRSLAVTVADNLPYERLRCIRRLLVQSGLSCIACCRRLAVGVWQKVSYERLREILLLAGMFSVVAWKVLRALAARLPSGNLRCIPARIRSGLLP